MATVAKLANQTLTGELSLLKMAPITTLVD